SAVRVRSMRTRLCACSSGGKVQAVDPAVQRAAADREQLGSGRFVAVGLLQHPFNVVALRGRKLGAFQFGGGDRRRRRNAFERRTLRGERGQEVTVELELSGDL